MASSLQFEALLKEIIAQEREEALEDLANGAAEDYPGYREAVGYIRALDAYADWCAEVGKKLEER